MRRIARQQSDHISDAFSAVRRRAMRSGHPSPLSKNAVHENCGVVAENGRRLKPFPVLVAGNSDSNRLIYSVFGMSRQWLYFFEKMFLKVAVFLQRRAVRMVSNNGS